MEIRSFGENAAPQLTEGRVIEGYAVVFNRDSRILYNKEKKRFFVERISPGAVTPELIRGCDIKAVTEHDRNRMLARSFNGKGTLTLSVDTYGVKYRFESPNTQEGDYAVEMVRRGDIFGSSFAYITDEKKNVRYSKRTDGILQRDVDKIDRMFDVSLVGDPAYFGTDVNVRSLDSFFEEPVDESYKEEINNLRKFI